MSATTAKKLIRQRLSEITGKRKETGKSDAYYASLDGKEEALKEVLGALE